MRWTDYTDTLAPAARATLLNAPTLGCGYVAFAASGRARDAPFGAGLDPKVTDIRCGRSVRAGDSRRGQMS